MKINTISFLLAILIATSALAASEPVKMSKSGICHPPNSTYYSQTKNYTSYKTLDECLKAGGRMPKR